MGKRNVVTGGRARKEAKQPVNVLEQASDNEEEVVDEPMECSVRKPNGKLRMKKKELKRLQKRKNVMKSKAVPLVDVEMMTEAELVAKVERKAGRAIDTTLARKRDKMQSKRGIQLAKKKSVKGTPLAGVVKLYASRSRTVEGNPMSKKKARKMAKRERYAQLDKAAKLRQSMVEGGLVKMDTGK